MPGHDASELAIRLGREAEAVCRHYLSSGQRAGRYWLVGDVQNTPGRSMFVRLTGPTSGKGAAGKWTDMATGEHGDLLDVIREALGLADFKDVAEEARRFLALPHPEPEKTKTPTGSTSSSAPGSPEASRRLFAMAQPIHGTLAAIYLSGRAITSLSDTTALRYHPRCYYRPDEHSPTEIRPALVAAVMTEDLHTNKRRHRVLMLLDEFPALGRLDFFESALAFMAGYGIKSFLIAQSLNQIEKAYGQNNAILDNCHVRVSFATNDERTAKRVSDALGTATEMKAMQNYAGSRLAPWLGHIMVSRSETARQLLTPGEIMQLPPDDEIVMVAGTAPIRARKARYFEDARLAERILPPPDPAKIAFAPRPDSWSTIKPLKSDAALIAVAEDTRKEKAEDRANSSLRREPELPEHVEIVHEKKELSPENEFKIILDDDQEDNARQRQAIRRQMGGIARQASLNPDDGIEL